MLSCNPRITVELLPEELNIRIGNIDPILHYVEENGVEKVHLVLANERATIAILLNGQI